MWRWIASSVFQAASVSGEGGGKGGRVGVSTSPRGYWHTVTWQARGSRAGEAGIRRSAGARGRRRRPVRVDQSPTVCGDLRRYSPSVLYAKSRGLRSNSTSAGMPMRRSAAADALVALTCASMSRRVCQLAYKNLAADHVPSTRRKGAAWTVHRSPKNEVKEATSRGAEKVAAAGPPRPSWV